MCVTLLMLMYYDMLTYYDPSKPEIAKAVYSHPPKKAAVICLVSNWCPPLLYCLQL